MLNEFGTNDTLKAISEIFADYVKPAGAIHQELGADKFTLQMTWEGFQVFADVSPIVAEVVATSKVSAEGRFKDLIDELILKFASEIVRKHEKMVKRTIKQEVKQSKVLRLLK